LENLEIEPVFTSNIELVLIGTIRN
jgi:hypothetical protein